MASGPITSWQIDGETMETVRDFIFLGSKITADGACSHEIKRRLLLGRKFMTNLDSIFKSRDITLPAKVRLVKAMVFPVVMHGCESWTVKKAECYARGPNPQNWENKTSTAMQTQKGNLLLARARTQVSSNAMEWNKGPEPWITAVFIGLKQRQGVDRGGLVARVP